MTDSEVKDFEDDLTNRMGGIIANSGHPWDTTNTIVKFAPTDASNVKAFLGMITISDSHPKIDLPLLTNIGDAVREIYDNSGLDKKKNGCLIVSEFRLSRYVGNGSRRLIVSYRYEYDKGSKNIDPLDRY